MVSLSLVLAAALYWPEISSSSWLQHPPSSQEKEREEEEGCATPSPREEGCTTPSTSTSAICSSLRTCRREFTIFCGTWISYLDLFNIC